MIAELGEWQSIHEELLYFCRFDIYHHFVSLIYEFLLRKHFILESIERALVSHNLTVCIHPHKLDVARPNILHKLRLFSISRGIDFSFIRDRRLFGDIVRAHFFGR